MSVTIEKINKNKVKLQIEIEAATFNEAMQKSYLKNAKNFAIAGFRKGKAPRQMVERHYGEGVLYEDAFNFIGGDAYDKAIEENNIYTVDRPEIDVVQIGTGKNLIFTAEVTIKPEVEIKDYNGIEVKKVEYNVSESDVDEHIEKMREKNARIITIDNRKLQKGDTVTMDFEGFLDGVPFEGGKGSDYELEIGSGSFIEGFEDQLVGMEINEEKEIKVTFPEEYHAKNLAGKDALFIVMIHSIKSKELPELDDEFAKDVSEFDTLDELKSDIRLKLEKSSNEKAKKEMEEQVMKSVAEKAEVEIPQVMIERQIDNMVKDFEWRLKYQGSNLKSYLEYTNTSYNKFRQMFNEKAQEAVKVQLVLEEIGKREEIEVSDEEINDRIAEMGKGYSQEIEEFKKHLKEDDIKYIKEEAEVEKTIKYLMDNAKIS